MTLPPQINEQAVVPGLDRRQVLDMAIQAGLAKTHPGMAPEVMAFAAAITAANRQYFADLIAPGKFLQPSDLEWMALNDACEKILGP